MTLLFATLAARIAEGRATDGDYLLAFLLALMYTAVLIAVPVVLAVQLAG